MERLEEFVCRGVGAYAARRNHVEEGHGNVSRLSGALRHRLIGEWEVVAAVMRGRGYGEVEKFLQEVVWRTYWKGWLEQRPGVWEDWKGLRGVGGAECDAVARGASGCGVMDGFARELVETGYLHNHARMWWASFWVHRMGLPWAVGAGHFFDHLIDADPASNTLGWRWVAGLQTRGKVYLVGAGNIERHMEGVDGGGLGMLRGGYGARVPVESADVRRVALPCLPAAAAGGGRVGLLLHVEDLSVECGPLGREDFGAVGILGDPREGVGEVARGWVGCAVEDAAGRAGRHWGVECERLGGVGDVGGWARREGLERVVAVAPGVGPLGDVWGVVREGLGAVGCRLEEVRREWDTRLYPESRAGFFPYWKVVGPMLRRGELA